MCESLLVFIIAGDIVLPVLDGVGQVLLGGPVVGVVMRVEVVLPLDLGVRAVVVLVLQMARDGSGAPGLNVCNGGIDAVTELKRNINSDNARRKIDGRAEAQLIELACGLVPEGHSRWTIRLLEKESKVILETPVGREAIRNALKKTNFDLTKTTTGASPQKKSRNS